jgi:hypothetical protein
VSTSAPRRNPRDALINIILNRKAGFVHAASQITPLKRKAPVV